MDLRALHRRVFLDGLYRRLLLRPSRENEPAERSAFKRRIGAAWDYLFYRPFENADRNLDLVCVVPRASRGWILEAICREILRYFPGKSMISYDHRNLPDAKAYFLSHYMLIKDAALYSPQILRKKLLIWYTHPREIGMQKADLVYWLNQSSRVVATCSHFQEMLVGDGVRPERIAVIIGGADADFFPGHVRRRDGAVGFCGAYYERKDPDRILEIVKRMPHRRFILLGPHWHQYPRFAELQACANFEHEEAGYDAYPAFYRRLSVFVSPSRLEGGPIPLLEAMMENVVPVASDTGFARDVIRHSINGYVFPVDDPIDSICSHIDSAFENDADVRASVQQFTWEKFSRNVQALL